MAIKRIVGFADSREVLINGKPLSPMKSQAIRNHSPDGFNWGYGGSGPSQLALAILLEFTSRAKAAMMYQNFKWDVIAGLPQGQDFVLEGSKVREWLKAKEAELGSVKHG